MHLTLIFTFIYFHLNCRKKSFPNMLTPLFASVALIPSNPERLAPGGKQKGKEKRAGVELHFLPQ